MTDEIIKKVYHDLGGFGSIQSTFKDAKAKDPSIKLSDVQAWMKRNVEKKTQVRGFNSFIADKPYEEFQMDLLFFNDVKDKDYQGGLLMVDIFSKFCSIIPIKSKTPDEILQAIKESFIKMEGKPSSIYSDDEGAFNSKVVQQYFKDNNIQSIITRTHAPVAERTIRTLKNMIYKRVEHTKQKWHDVLSPSLLTYNYKQ